MLCSLFMLKTQHCYHVDWFLPLIQTKFVFDMFQDDKHSGLVLEAIKNDALRQIERER